MGSESSARSAVVAVCAIVFMIVGPTVTPTHAGDPPPSHGAIIQIQCDTRTKVGDVVVCTHTLEYDDDFGDSLEITEAWGVADPAGDAIRIPTVGNLTQIEIVPNTNARWAGEVGQLPVIIGEVGSTANGLPGLAIRGAIRATQDEYVARPEDLGRLGMRAEFIVVDQCNGEQSDTCVSLPNTFQFTAQTDVYSVFIEIENVTPPTEVCEGQMQSVEFVYEVTNPEIVAGAVAPLANVVVTDDACSPAERTGSSGNDDDVLDPGETWTFTCTTDVSTAMMSTVGVTATDLLFGCDVAAEDTMTITTNPPPICAFTLPPMCANSTEHEIILPDAGADATYEWTLTGGTFNGPTDGPAVTFSIGNGPAQLCVTATDAKGCACMHCEEVILLPPAECDDTPPERAHPGWNWVDVARVWTAEQPAYWSALDGTPGPDGAALPPFTILDPSEGTQLPGRPATDGTTDRVLRGFIYAWAVDAADREISWNHLEGGVTFVNYRDGRAWEYNAWAFQDAQNLAPGTLLAGGAGAGVLEFDGSEYVNAFSQLLLDFYAPGASAFDGSGVVLADTSLTLHPLRADLRQETTGPVTTRATFVIWNEDETQFTNLHRCLTCWDQQLLSLYTEGGVQNHFLGLQTDKGKARIDGVASQWCSSSCCLARPAGGCDDFGCQEQVCSIDPFCCSIAWDLGCATLAVDLCDACESLNVTAPLLGVAAKLISFPAGRSDMAGTNLIGMGLESAVVRYDLEPSGGNDPPTFTRDDPWANEVTDLLRLAGVEPGLSDPTPPAPQPLVGGATDRVSGTEKGSFLAFSNIELRWDADGELVQDAFVALANDLDQPVRIKMYFVNGDPPLEAE